ncbi:hypothetical protein Tco_0422747 [Tanacetum coccineum]
MAFISSSNTNSGKSEVPTVQGVSTTSVQPASVQVSTASTDVAAANLSYDIVCAFIATQPNGSQNKYEDITQIDDDDIEEMDIKWNLALLSMRADRSPKSQDRGKIESYKKDPKVEELAPKAMIAIDGIGWDWSYMAAEDEASKNHALVADEEEVPTEYALMAKSSSSSDNEFDCKQDIWLDKGKTWARVNHDHDNMKYPSTHKSMTPRAVLLKSGTKLIATLRPFSTARPTLNTAKNKDWVPTVRTKFPTIGSKVPTTKPTVAADKGNKRKAVKASARWIWKPKQNSSG